MWVLQRVPPPASSASKSANPKILCTIEGPWILEPQQTLLTPRSQLWSPGQSGSWHPVQPSHPPGAWPPLFCPPALLCAGLSRLRGQVGAWAEGGLWSLAANHADLSFNRRGRNPFEVTEAMYSTMRLTTSACISSTPISHIAISNNTTRRESVDMAWKHLKENWQNP